MTPRGYEFFEVASAMQKEIRRANEESAMFWAVELSVRYPAFTWYRLATIASEDIGPADNNMVILIDVLRRNAAECTRRPGRPTERIMLAHAVIALCRAPKSRIADDLCALTSHRIESEGEKLEIPDYALDFHTKRGRAKGRQIDDRGWDHWAAEGCKLANEADDLRPDTPPGPLNIYRDRALKLRKKHGRLKERPAAGKREAKRRERNLLDMFDVVENERGNNG
jgi:hypothetical protein